MFEIKLFSKTFMMLPTNETYKFIDFILKYSE